jgi:putative two-component system response regulator
MLQQFNFDKTNMDRLIWDRMSRHQLARHERIVGLLSGVVGKAMGLGLNECKLLTRAAALHDIGKADIALSIWSKEAPLDAEETSLVHQHPILGYLRLKAHPRSADLNLAALIALEHHERWDGRGYPAGKKGSEISLPARITSICDVYSALREKR